jgi:ankyrin repeat protein
MLRRLLEWLVEYLLYWITRVLSLLCSGDIVNELFIQCRQSADELPSSSSSSLEEIKNLVQDFPGAVKARNKEGVCPLDVACLYGARLEVIQFLAEQYPAAVKIRGGYNRSHSNCNVGRLRMPWSNRMTSTFVHRRLPLHWACRGNASLEVIRYVLELEPDAIAAPGLRGMLPLHEACRSNRRTESETLKVIHYLVSKYPNAVKITDMEWGYLPLHAALGRRPGKSPSVIEFLIKRYPKALTIENKNGQLPLHLACARETPVQVIQCMVKQYNASIVARDIKGKLPIEIACRRQAPADIMESIVADAWGDDWPPLHFACIHHASLDAIHYLRTMLIQQQTMRLRGVRKNGDNIVNDEDDWGEPAAQAAGRDRLLPLHCACRAGNATNVSVIDFLYNHYPHGIKSRDNAKGELPLHCACRSKAGLDIITSLVQKNSDALLVPDAMGYLPLHLSILHDAAPETIFFLMSEHPDALLLYNNNNHNHRYRSPNATIDENYTRSQVMT